MPRHRPVGGLGWAFADHDHVLDPLPRLRRASACGEACAAPARSADTWPARAGARRGPGRRSTGRSSRATPTSPDRRESPPAAVARSARGCDSPSAGPGPLDAAAGSPPASPAGPGHRPGRCWSARCWATLARYTPPGPELRRSSRLIVRRVTSRRSGRSRGPRPRPRAGRRSPPARPASTGHPRAGVLRGCLSDGITPPDRENNRCAVGRDTPTRRRHPPPRAPQRPAPRTLAAPPPAPADAPYIVTPISQGVAQAP